MNKSIKKKLTVSVTILLAFLFIACTVLMLGNQSNAVYADEAIELGAITEKEMLKHYSTIAAEKNEAEYVMKSISSDNEEYYNIYYENNIISDVSASSLQHTECSTSGYIPNESENLESENYNLMNLSGIIGSDDRIRITDTYAYPYSAICFIYIIFPDGAGCKGTAWMYWSNIAVTAGHCVYDSSHGGWAESIEVIPGANGDSSPYGKAKAKTMHTTTLWTTTGLPAYDYAVIELDTNLGDLTGYFGAYYNTSSLTKSNITLTGYPGEYERQMWTMSGTVSATLTDLIQYSIDSTQGQSGSPVYWYSSSKGYQAIAIDASYSPVTNVNYGTRITYAVFNFITSFRK